MRAIVTPSGIELPEPDQGTLFCRIELEYPGSYIDVWEPFDDPDQDGGHDLLGLMERWEMWRSSERPFLMAIDPRFGFPVGIPRSAIEAARRFCLVYHRREDTRAGVVSSLLTPGQGGMRRLPNGDIEIQVPIGMGVA